MAEGGEIIEGFLCPICKADLKSPENLQNHFQEEHSEDQDVIKSIKGLLGKAKKRILKLEDDELPTSFESSAEVVNRLYLPIIETQELGATRKYSEYFRDIRNKRLERYAAETNKLLIRLDKLLLDLPLDPIKRKTYEQTIVPWIDDRDVKLCPNCAKSFHVARRKHHCRLCGAIMCNDCSHFLQLPNAKKMTTAGFGQESSQSSSNKDSLIATKQNNSSSVVLGQSNSSSSLSSVLSLVDNMTGEQQFRLCVHCKHLLETRERLKENRTQKPIISQFYERLSSYISEFEHMNVRYSKLCESVQCGEKYNLTEAQNLRGKLLQLAENIDTLSKKIAVLGTKDVENPPRGRTLHLQQMVKVATSSYIKEWLSGLPPLPLDTKMNLR